MTAHRSQSTATPADAAIRQWSGTPAEWDAELTARMNRLVEANFTAGSRSVRYVATATMPPRPVEPPYTCEQCGVTDGDVYRFLGNYGHLTAESCREALKRELRALRDGPAPRYEVCGWQAHKWPSIVSTWSATDTFDVAGCERLARAHVSKCGGTAHAIYRRVEGKGCVVCGGEIAAVGSRYCESHTSHGGPCSTEAPRD